LSSGENAYDDALNPDETSLGYIEAYGMSLWRNGSTDASRTVFEGLCKLAQTSESPEVARYTGVLRAIDATTYEAYVADVGE
jgi:hypothetical protein